MNKNGQATMAEIAKMARESKSDDSLALLKKRARGGQAAVFSIFLLSISSIYWYNLRKKLLKLKTQYPS